jgi:photosystem II stability/assembly factor-like uncharacterized protein
MSHTISVSAVLRNMRHEAVFSPPCVAALLFLLWICSATGEGAEWQWQHPLPQGNTLWKVAFADERSGYAVGDAGTIMATADAGETWLLQYEGVTDNLRDVAAVDSMTAWCAGDNGMILHTTDGGAHWQEQPSGTVNGLNAIWFSDRMDGWAAGDARTIIRTTDEGRTWLPATLPAGQGSGSINAIAFTSPTDGWAAGSASFMGGVSGILYRSLDAGVTWTLVQTLNAPAHAIEFAPGGTTGVIAGAGGLIVATSNGGTSWVQVTSGSSRGLNDVFAASSNEFWIVGDDSTLLHSLSAGTTWTQEPLRETYASINGLAGAGPNVVAVGEYGFLSRKKPGLPWISLNDGNYPAINWLAFSDQSNGIAVGQWGSMLRTSNGGESWLSVDNGLTGDSFYGAAYVSEKIWVVGDLGVLLHSSDRGMSWTQQTTNTTMTLLSIAFVDGLHGYAVGDNGTLLRTNDGGDHWAAGISGTSAPLYGIAMRPNSLGWIVGEFGTIRHTSDTESWSPQASPVSTVLWSTSFVDDFWGYAAGGSGVILRTTTGGSSWTPGSTGTSRNIFVAEGTSRTHAYAIGDTGLVLRSEDGGSLWSPDFAKTACDLFALRVLDDDLAWLGGDNGTILRTGIPHIVAAGISSRIAGELSLSLHLDQNSPNPFNPSTSIGFAVSGPGVKYVRLAVYDLSGREVAALVDEPKQPGNHTVKWNANGMASGVYFYRLTVDGSSESKRMVLLR